MEETEKGRQCELKRNEGIMPGKVKERGPHRGGGVVKASGATSFSDGGQCFGGRRRAEVGP
jgi:hypothetical protein